MDYTQVRQKSRIYRDGLRCRTQEVIKTLDALGFESGALLDIGAADGAMLAKLIERYPRAHYLGIDAHEPYVQAAQARRMPVVVASAEEIPCRTDRFDVVTIVSTLKHIANHRSVLRECMRVLRPGGHLLLSDVSPLGIFLGEMGGHFHNPPVLRHWSVRDCEDELDRVGFEVVAGHHYMPLPIATPYDERVTKLLTRLGASAMCMQQMVVAHKPFRQAEVIPLPRKIQRSKGQSVEAQQRKAQQAKAQPPKSQQPCA